MHLNLVRYDGGLWLSQSPPYILKYLRYSHRSFKLQGYRRVNSFEEVRLYNLQPDGSISTLGGFYEKIIGLINENLDTVEIQDNRSKMPAPDWDRVKEIGFRDHQIEPVAKFLLSAQQTSGVVSATGGYGKTYCQAWTYAAWSQLNCILAIPIAQVVKQTVKKFKELFPDKHVGQIGAGKDDLSQDITIATFDSLQKAALEKCQLFLVDEMQCAARPTFQADVAKFQPARTFGYTATDDGLFSNADKLLVGMFGEHLIHIEYEEAESVGAVVPCTVWMIEVPPDTLVTGNDMESKFSQGIEQCKPRNSLIGLTCSLVPEKWQTLVFVDRINTHLIPLMMYMPAGTQYIHRGSSKKKHGAYALTGKRQDQIAESFSNNEFQHLIATDAFRAGVDVPNIRVVVQAAGGSSKIEVLQEALRGSRTLKEEDRERFGVTPKTHFCLIDFVDQHDDSLMGMTQKRIKYYRDQKWQINFVKHPREIDWYRYEKSLL